MERYDDLIMELVRGEEPFNEAAGAFPICTSSSSVQVQVEMNILWKVENLWIHISPGGAASIVDRSVVENLAIKIAPFDYQILMLRSGNGNHSIFHQLFSEVLASMGVKPSVQVDIVREIVEFARGAIPRDGLASAGTTIFPLRVTFTARTMHVMSSSDDQEKGMTIPATGESIRALKRVTTLVDDEKCVICLEELVDGTEATAMPCSHLFHGSCITAWLEESHLCPLCRFQMPTSSSSSSIHYIN